MERSAGPWKSRKIVYDNAIGDEAAFAVSDKVVNGDLFARMPYSLH